MTLSVNIRKYRLAARLSQEGLAQAAGLGHMTVSRLERGSPRPSLDTLQKLARALGVSLDDLAGARHASGGSKKQG